MKISEKDSGHFEIRTQQFLFFKIAFENSVPKLRARVQWKLWQVLITQNLKTKNVSGAKTLYILHRLLWNNILWSNIYENFVSKTPFPNSVPGFSQKSILKCLELENYNVSGSKNACTLLRTLQNSCPQSLFLETFLSKSPSKSPCLLIGEVHGKVSRGGCHFQKLFSVVDTLFQGCLIAWN